MTREEAKEAKETLLNAAWLGTDKDREKVEEAVKIAVQALEERKDGTWIPSHNDIQLYVLRCSCCGFINEWGYDEKTGKGTYFFCPNCGARMIEPPERKDKE